MTHPCELRPRLRTVIALITCFLALGGALALPVYKQWIPLESTLGKIFLIASFLCFVGIGGVVGSYAYSFEEHALSDNLKYADAVSQYGSQSSIAQEIRLRNLNNEEFKEFADAIDHIKESLSPQTREGDHESPA